MVRAAHYGIEINNWNFTDFQHYSYKSYIDLMMFLCNRKNHNAVSMDIACRSYGISSHKEGEVNGETVSITYENEKIDTVNEYVMQDVELTHQLFEKLKE